MGKLSVLCLLSLSLAVVPSLQDSTSDKVSHSLIEFAKKLYGAYAKSSHATGNEIFSPFLTFGALGVAKAASRGVTATEIQKVMGGLEDDVLFSGYNELYKSVHGDSSFTLTTVNALGINKDFPVQQAFKDLVKEKFSAEILELDYSDVPGTVARVNKYAADSTGGKIPGVLTEDKVKNLQSLVLYNALYFKGEWETAFKKEDSKDGDWHKDAATTIKVPMMSVTTEMWFANCPELGAKIIGIPYKGEQVWMLMGIPNEKDGLAAMKEKLKDYPLHEAVAKAKTGKRTVHLTMPKFKMQEEIDVKEALIALGAPSIFNKATADFSAVPATPKPLWVEEALQKVYFCVDEQGSEAAARVGKKLGRGLEKTEEVEVNHPFAFTIAKFSEDKEAKVVLFAGRITDPTKHT